MPRPLNLVDPSQTPAPARSLQECPVACCFPSHRHISRLRSGGATCGNLPKYIWCPARSCSVRFKVLRIPPASLYLQRAVAAGETGQLVLPESVPFFSASRGEQPNRPTALFSGPRPELLQSAPPQGQEAEPVCRSTCFAESLQLISQCHTSHAETHLIQKCPKPRMPQRKKTRTSLAGPYLGVV